MSSVAARSRGHAARAHRSRGRALRRLRDSELTWLAGLLLLVALLAAVTLRLPDDMTLAWLVLPTLVGGLTLSLPRLLVLCAAVALAALVVLGLEGPNVRRLAAVLLVLAVAAIVVWNARSRSRLGVVGSRGESMLIDLRDRLQSQGELPELPRQWYVEAVLRSAGGASFAGDFVVAAKTQQGRKLEVAVVDVSGKGLHAGTRALLLSGAFGGLLGSLPPEEFLPAANYYLLRQEWGEGFATAIHLELDLRDGSMVLRSAGHPPAVQLHAGSGRWVLHESQGPVLGLLQDAEFVCAPGRLLPGDALLLYTDGLVETPQRDLTLGIDKLVGEAERLVRGGFERGASRLLDRIDSKDDDRALLLIHRRV